jgi:hypothetical protein
MAATIAESDARLVVAFTESRGGVFACLVAGGWADQDPGGVDGRS